MIPDLPAKALTASAIMGTAIALDVAIVPLAIGAVAVVLAGYGEPLLKAAFRHGYRAVHHTHRAFSEAKESALDIVAEVHAEDVAEVSKELPTAPRKKR